MSPLRAGDTNTGVGRDAALLPDLPDEGGCCVFQKAKAPTATRQSRMNQNHQCLKNDRLTGCGFDSIDSLMGSCMLVILDSVHLRFQITHGIGIVNMDTSASRRILTYGHKLIYI